MIKEKEKGIAREKKGGARAKSSCKEYSVYLLTGHNTKFTLNLFILKQKILF